MSSKPLDKDVCKVCLKKVLDRGVECDGPCSHWYHPDCVKVTPTEYRKIADGSVKSWKCGRVDCCAPDSGDSISDLSNKISALLDKFATLATKDEISDLSHNITAKLDEFSNSFKVLEERVTCNEERIKNVERQLGDTPRGDVDPDVTIAEINERARRAKNVMLFNLPESNNRDVNAKKEHDLKLIKGICLELMPGASVDITATLRVGKKQSDKPRPLKVVLKDESVVKTLLKNFSVDIASRYDRRLSTLRMSRDRTPLEIKYFKKLVTELEARKGSGEGDLRIVYRNGIPQIQKVPKNV